MRVALLKHAAVMNLDPGHTVEFDGLSLRLGGARMRPSEIRAAGGMISPHRRLFWNAFRLEAIMHICWLGLKAGALVI